MSDAVVYMHPENYRRATLAIDVSTLSGACPRCTGRRVWRVSVPTDEWSCVPNAIPFPWLREHVREHDATETQELGQVNE